MWQCVNGLVNIALLLTRTEMLLLILLPILHWLFSLGASLNYAFSRCKTLSEIGLRASYNFFLFSFDEI